MSQSITPTPSAGQARVEGPLGASTEGLATSAGAVSRPAQEALAQLEAVARELEGQPEALLGLLRSLEQLHRSIQDGAFRASLPADRNDLFRLLSEMERSGGWPYIPRLQLRTFLDLLTQGGDSDLPCDGPLQEGDALQGDALQGDAPRPELGGSARLAA